MTEAAIINMKKLYECYYKKNILTYKVWKPELEIWKGGAEKFRARLRCSWLGGPNTSQGLTCKYEYEYHGYYDIQ